MADVLTFGSFFFFNLTLKPFSQKIQNDFIQILNSLLSATYIPSQVLSDSKKGRKAPFACHFIYRNCICTGEEKKVLFAFRDGHRFPSRLAQEIV